ncbi:Arc family DNA-binding protein [Pantoea sp.]|uniref:Arc family DNA-binding protein n=1 Tax=Pantoea sp. TaxID=69393 RepID=UPI0028A92E5F|nr:Arc family DNA-binding protein [Pantoea sp.]
MARDDPQFNLRMTQELKDLVAASAKKNGRSMNSEILQMLQDAIAAEQLKPTARAVMLTEDNFSAPDRVSAMRTIHGLANGKALDAMGWAEQKMKEILAMTDEEYEQKHEAWMKVYYVKKPT